MKGSVSLKTFKNTYSTYLMTSNQTRASSLSYTFDKLFPKILPRSYHSPEAKLSGAADSLKNKDDLQSGNQGLTQCDPDLPFQNYISFLTYTKFLLQPL